MKEEAIKKLKDILREATETDDAVCYVTSNDADALNVAIKLLERETKTDILDKIYDEINNIDSMTFVGNGSGCASDMKSECLAIIDKYKESEV